MVWTDVFQCVILFAGLLVVVALVCILQSNFLFKAVQNS